jgi:hypothetical protein
VAAVVLTALACVPFNPAERQASATHFYIDHSFDSQNVNQPIGTFEQPWQTLEYALTNELQWHEGFDEHSGSALPTAGD